MLFANCMLILLHICTNQYHYRQPGCGILTVDENRYQNITHSINLDKFVQRLVQRVDGDTILNNRMM